MSVQKTVFVFKIEKTSLPEYLFNMIPQSNHRYNTQSSEDVTTFYCRTDVFKYSYSPYNIKNYLLKTGWPTAKPTYNIHNPIGLKFLTRLRLELSHLNKHKFKHNFQDCVNTLCSCSLKIESLSHFFLHCNHFTNIRANLLDDLQSVDINILSFSDNDLGDLFLYGSPNFNLNQNNKILSSSTSFIIKSVRFSGSLF